MNPHNPAERPGAHLVAEAFGVEDPWALSDNQPLHTPLDLVGRMVAEAAHEVDELHGELTRAAQAAIRVLEPISRGEQASMRGWEGALRTAGPQIELLVARRGAAYEQLDRAVYAYRRLQPGPAPGHPVQATARAIREEEKPGRDDDCAIPGDRRLTALETVAAGGVRFHQSAVFGYTWVSDGSGRAPHIRPETIQRLVADGLVDQDTSESLYRPGHRISAALSRSNTATTATTTATAGPAAAALSTGSPAKPSRSV